MSNPIVFESQNFSANPNIKQKNPYKVLFFIFFTLFLITASSVITVIFLKYKISIINKINKLTTSSINTNTPTIIPNITSKPTSTEQINNWKIQTSKLGFAIQIPNNYFFQDAEDTNGNVRIQTWDPNSNKYPPIGGIPTNESLVSAFLSKESSIKEYEQNNPLVEPELTQILSKEKISINGKPAQVIRYKTKVEGDTEGLDYLIEVNNSILHIVSYINQSTDQKTKDQFYSDATKIIESIKFN